MVAAQPLANRLHRVEQAVFGNDGPPRGVIRIPEPCTPAECPIACFLSQVQAQKAHSALVACGDCGYPVLPEAPCVNCAVPPEPVPRPVVVCPTHGSAKIPFVVAEGWFLREVQRAWVKARGLSHACQACGYAVAHEQTHCLLCMSRRLYR